MNTFGKRLKKQRLKLGLTQSELADKLKVSRSAISNWEVGRNYPDLDILLSLSQLFSVTVDQLLNEEPALVTIISQDQRGNRKRKMILRVLVN